MSKWLYKHYKMVCMVFLGIVFVGWTAFTDISDRKAATADASAGTNTQTAKNGDSGGEQAGAITPRIGENNPSPSAAVTDEPAVPTQVAKDDPAVTDTVDPATPGGDAQQDSSVPSDTDPTQNAESGSEPGDGSQDGNGDASQGGDEPGNTDDPIQSVDDPGTGDDAGENPGDTTDPVTTGTPDDTQNGDDTPALEITFKYAVAAVDSRLNIRRSPGTDSSVIAYLKSNGYCEVLEWGSEWTKIQSGSVTGYAYTPYLLFNNDAIKKLRSLNKLFVRVTSNTVNIRAAATTESEKLGKGTRDAKFIYLPEQSVEGWYCIQYSETQVAYVSADYTEVYIDTSVAIPIS